MTKIIDNDGNELSLSEVKEYIESKKPYEETISELYNMLDGIIGCYLNGESGEMDKLIRFSDGRLDELIEQGVV